MRKKKIPFIEQLGVHTILLAAFLIMAIPFFWMVSTSFKNPDEIYIFPPRWVPHRPTFDNYVELFKTVDFGRPLINTVIVAVTSTFLSVMLSAMAGYGFAKFRFRGKEKLFLLVLATLMVPGQMTLIPVYLILNSLNLLNTYAGLILPGVASAFGIFFMRQFIMSIPDELIDAAKMDGAKEFFIFLKIILPLSKPALATLTIFNFVGAWNSFLWPLIVATDEKMYTLPVAISVVQGQYGEKIALQMSGSFIVIIPIIIVFFFAQKYIIKGLSMSGMKF
ncbi:sugar ABC transporter permease [Kosmotoga arenicorallina S304]|uniref:Sugar ABC transporter permease n=1 Tax=Kosmotoga arenicorallina S304 TaxID=1453497 RepID=A0A176K2M1_9BACT|nr:carbohydrate ABC transporter permease [Kosmotoga arenicorallina]OAA31520.1 sugar ABC transporter permease [Kosmotoga arenicorallina S304]